MLHAKKGLSLCSVCAIVPPFPTVSLSIALSAKFTADDSKFDDCQAVTLDRRAMFCILRSAGYNTHQKQKRAEILISQRKIHQSKRVQC